MAIIIENIITAEDDFTLSAELLPTTPFDFHASLNSLKESGATDQTETLAEDLSWLERPLMLDNRPFLVRLANAGSLEQPRLSLRLRADEDADSLPTTAHLEKATQWADRRFYLTVNLEEIRAALSVNEYGENLCARFFPARPTGLGGAWEGLLRTVIANQIYPGLAKRLQETFLTFYGAKVRFGDKEYHLFPTPEKLAEVSPDELQSMRFSRQKAAYLPGIANMILAEPEKFDFERLSHLPGHEAVAILDELPGVGKWTAHYVAMRGLCHPDVFIDEKGLRKTLASGYDRRADLSDEEFESLTAVFAPYRTFACYYSYMRMYNV
jgi:DNA-3-methyladenine glycosylase II